MTVMGVIWLHEFELENRTRARNRWKCAWCGFEVLQERVKLHPASNPDLPPTPVETGWCGSSREAGEIVVRRRKKGPVY